jgi:hypothetical protein
VQLKVSSEIEDSIELKCDRGETDKNNTVCSVSFADSTMLFARGPQPARVAVELSSGETAPNRDLTGNLVEILDDVKAGKTDPAQDDEDSDKLSGTCARSSTQSWSLSSILTNTAETGYRPVTPVLPCLRV